MTSNEPESISRSEWLAEMERLSALPNQQEGVTREKLSECLGLSTYRTRKFLKAGIKAKHIIAKPALRPNIIGTPTRTVVYSLVPKGD